MNLIKIIYWNIIEIIWCRIKGHKLNVVKDIKIKDPTIPFDGVQILECEHCKRTKLAWYIKTKDKAYR